MTLNPLGLPLRTCVHGGQIHFYLFDIAALLRIRQQRRVIDSLDADEFTTLDMVTGNAEDANVVILTEPAVYKIALRMHSPFGRALLRYVCHEVLPQMRTRGSAELPSGGILPQGAALVSFLKDTLSEEAALENDLPW